MTTRDVRLDCLKVLLFVIAGLPFLVVHNDAYADGLCGDPIHQESYNWCVSNLRKPAEEKMRQYCTDNPSDCVNLIAALQRCTYCRKTINAFLDEIASDPKIIFKVGKLLRTVKAASIIGLLQEALSIPIAHTPGPTDSPGGYTGNYSRGSINSLHDGDKDARERSNRYSGSVTGDITGRENYSPAFGAHKRTDSSNNWDMSIKSDGFGSVNPAGPMTIEILRDDAN